MREKLRRIIFGILVLSVAVISSPLAEEIPASPDFNSLNIQQQLQVINQEAEKGISYAKSLFNKGEVKRALEVLTKINKFAPYHPQAYILQLRYYQETGQENEIFKVLEEAGKSIANFDIIFPALRFQKMKELVIEDAALSSVNIAPFKDNKEAAVSFNFDDGPRSVYTQALPLMDKFNFKGTIHVNPSVVTDTHTNPAWGSWEEWKDAHRRGYEIGNHAYRHRNLVEVLPENWDHEINGSFDMIKEKIGEAPVSFVFPHDSFNDQLMNKAKERHLAIRAHDYLTQVYDRIFIPVYGGEYFSLNTANEMIELAMKRKLWLIPECHAIYSDDIKTYKPLTAEFLEKHLRYIKEHEDRIWVDTFSQVYIYLMEKRFSTLETIWVTNQHVRIKVKTHLEPSKILMPLTVIVAAPTNQLKNVSVFQDAPATRKTPFKIQGNKILIDIFPNSETVNVSW